jgi:hypothetical protein
MSPIHLAIAARVVVLVAAGFVGAELGALVMRGAVAAAGSRVPGAEEAAAMIAARRLVVVAGGLFVGVLATQVWLRLRRAHAYQRATLWLAVASAVLGAAVPSIVLWVRAADVTTTYPVLLAGTSVALAGFLPPVAAAASAAWWWAATTWPLPAGSSKFKVQSSK